MCDGDLADQIRFAHVRLAVKSFDFTFELDEQRLAFAIECFVGWYFDPALRNAILFHIKAVFVVEANANIVFEHCSHVVRTAWVDRQMIGEVWALCGCVSHGIDFP